MRLSKTFPVQAEHFDFLPYIKREKNGRMRTRLLALQNLKEGKKMTELCEHLKVSRQRVRHWVNRFLELGISGLREMPGRGRKPRLCFEEKVMVSNFIEERSYSNEGGRLFGEDIVRFIKHNFGKEYSLSSAYRTMYELGFSWITSRSVHPQHDATAQKEFKKNFIESQRNNPQRYISQGC